MSQPSGRYRLLSERLDALEFSTLVSLSGDYSPTAADFASRQMLRLLDNGLTITFEADLLPKPGESILVVNGTDPTVGSGACTLAAAPGVTLVGTLSVAPLSLEGWSSAIVMCVEEGFFVAIGYVPAG